MENLLNMKIINDQWSGYDRQKQNELFSDIESYNMGSICSGSITRRATGAIGSDPELVVPLVGTGENVSIGCSDQPAASTAPVAWEHQIEP